MVNFGSYRHGFKYWQVILPVVTTIFYLRNENSTLLCKWHLILVTHVDLCRQGQDVKVIIVIKESF